MHRNPAANELPRASASRIVGLDVARTLAICGMVFVHFAMVLSHSDMTGPWLARMTDSLAGRPAALFMVLAGIGVTLRLQGQARNTGPIRKTLLKRGLFLFAAGIVNLVVWPGDILRVYGIAYVAAAWLLLARSWQLWSATLTVVLSFVILIFFVDFETNWDFSRFHYADLWTPSGALLNLFYNGFRSVLPWLALMFLGMLVGRQDLRATRVRRRMFVMGAALWLAAAASSVGLMNYFRAHPAGMDDETIVALFGTRSLPAMPLFLASSTGSALMVIMACVHLTENNARRGTWLEAAAATGQMAFTWYIAHIVVVAMLDIATDGRGTVPATVTLASLVGFCLMMLVLSCNYRRRFRYGPLERALRSFAP